MVLVVLEGKFEGKKTRGQKGREQLTLLVYAVEKV